MNINSIYPYLHQFLDRTYEKLSQGLTFQQKKIAAVALLIFSALALLSYFVYSRCKANELLDETEGTESEIETLQDEDSQYSPQAISFTHLATETKAHIFDLVNEPLVSQQVCKEWAEITEVHVLPSLVKSIENYLGTSRVQAVYSETRRKRSTLDLSNLAAKEKLHLLLQNQRQELNQILEVPFTEKMFNLFRKKERLIRTQFNIDILAKFISNEQWINNYRVLLKFLPVQDQPAFAERIRQEKTQFALASLVQQQFHQHTSDFILSDCRLTNVPREICQLSRLQNLDLMNNQLSQFPTIILQISQLKALWLDHNQLTQLPTEIGQLSELGTLSLGDNRLTQLSIEIGQLSQLKELSLSDNQLTQIPAEIGQLHQLKTLWLNGNPLNQFPTEIVQLSRLQQLGLDRHQITQLPLQIRQLNQLLIIRY